MLPQFGYIVAQAGADSHPPASTKSSTIPASSHSTKPFQPHLPNEPYSYYGRHPSPSNSTQTPILPPPLPYMYSAPLAMGREEYYNTGMNTMITANNTNTTTVANHMISSMNMNNSSNISISSNMSSINNSNANSNMNINNNSTMNISNNSTLNINNNNTMNMNNSNGPISINNNNSNNKYYMNDIRQQEQHNIGYRPLQPMTTLLHHPPPPTSNLWLDGNYTPEHKPMTSTVWSANQPQPVYQESNTVQSPKPIPMPTITTGIMNNTSVTTATNPTRISKSIPSPRDQLTPPTTVAPNDQLDYYDDPYPPYYQTRWQEEPIEVNENKMLRHIREFNDLMSWMDTEFWEQCDEIYQEKLQSLQEEVIAIQQGTHSAFKEIMADIEIRREQTIQNAEYFRNYELTLTKKQFEQDLALLDKEYESEKHNLHDMVLQSIEDKRKQIKEDKDDTPFQIEDLFRDAYSRISSRRNLRKRNGMDRNSSSSPSRQERRRYNRPTIPHNIHAQPTSTEEDELESEFLTMKGGVSTRRQATLNQSKR